ncbi:hypothetical protein ACK8P5_14955 [Paenibacillus sp. EC2-1]
MRVRIDEKHGIGSKESNGDSYGCDYELDIHGESGSERGDT